MRSNKITVIEAVSRPLSNGEYGFWAVTTYDDVNETSHGKMRFAQAYGKTADEARDGCIANIPPSRRLPEYIITNKRT